MTKDNNEEENNTPKKIKKPKKVKADKDKKIKITKKDEENILSLGKILEEWDQEQAEFEEDGEVSFDIKNFEKLVGRLKEIKLILLDMGIEENDATVIVDNLVFLAPPELLDSKEIEILVNNYCEYIKVVYDFCKARNYPPFLLVELVNDFGFVIDNIDESGIALIRYIKIELPIEIAKVQLEIRDRILQKLLKDGVSEDVAFSCIGKIQVLVLPEIKNILEAEKNKDGISVMEEIIIEFGSSLVKLYKLYCKELGAAARLIGTSSMNSLVITDMGDGEE